MHHELYSDSQIFSLLHLINFDFRKEGTVGNGNKHVTCYLDNFLLNKAKSHLLIARLEFLGLRFNSIDFIGSID